MNPYHMTYLAILYSNISKVEIFAIYIFLMFSCYIKSYREGTYEHNIHGYGSAAGSLNLTKQANQSKICKKYKQIHYAKNYTFIVQEVEKFILTWRVI